MTPESSLTVESPSSLSGLIAPENTKRTPIRPLGKISTYAATQLPTDIEAVRSGTKSLLTITNDITEMVKESTKPQDVIESEIPLALHDVASIASGIRVLETDLGERTSYTPHALQAVIDILAKRRNLVPYLSYEGLIFANPIEKDPRTFLKGDFGRQELIFYKLHQLIEAKFNTCLPSAFANLIDASKDTQDASDFLRQSMNQIEKTINAVTQYMTMFGPLVSYNSKLANLGIAGKLTKMENRSDAQEEVTMEETDENSDAFAFGAMRPFWSALKNKNGETIFQGPSGKFSAGYVVMDAVIAGKDRHMSKFIETKLTTHELPHYPNTSFSSEGFAGRQDMITAYEKVQEFGDLLTISKKIGDPDLIQCASKIVSLAEKNRNAHMSLAKKYLPIEFYSNQPGTGDSLPMSEYLQKPKSAYEKLRNQQQ